ncbi:MAG: lysostaphin resistance A-like protein [Opitutales bacterium]
MSTAQFLAGLILAVSLACLLVDTALFWKRSAGRPPPPWRVTPFDFVLFVWLVLVAAVVGGLIADVIGRQLNWSEDSQHALLLVTTQGSWLVVAMAFFLYFKGQVQATDSWEPPISLVRGVGFGVFFLFAALPLVFVVQMGWAWLLEYIYPQAQSTQEVVELLHETDSAVALGFLIFGAIVLAPVAEELIFRHGLFRYFLRFGSPNAAAWASGLLFGLIHWYFVAIVPLAVLGYLFARAYHKTGRLIVPMVMHGLFNALTVLWRWLPMDAE